MPTLPLASTVKPDPLAVFAWIRATVPFKLAPVLATYNKPFVELRAPLDEPSESILPVVRAFAFMLSGVCVEAVDQFQVCAKFSESIVFVAVAAVKPLRGNE